MPNDVRKNRVKEIRNYLAAIGAPISAVQGYEVMARAFGLRDANTLAGMSASQVPTDMALAIAPAASQAMRLPQFLLSCGVNDGYLDYEGNLFILGKHVVELRLSVPKVPTEKPHWSLMYGDANGRSNNPDHHATDDISRAAAADCLRLVADREETQVCGQAYLWSPQPLQWAHVSKSANSCDYDSFETQLLAVGNFIIDMMLIVPAEPKRDNQPYVGFMVGDKERRGELCCAFNLNAMDAAALLGGAHSAAGLN